MGAGIKTERQIKGGQDKKIAGEKKKRTLNFAAYCGERKKKKKKKKPLTLLPCETDLPHSC